MFYVFSKKKCFNEIFLNFMPILQRSFTLENKLTKNASKPDKIRVTMCVFLTIVGLFKPSLTPF